MISWPVYRLTLRALLGGRRSFVLVGLALVPVIAATIFAASGELDPRIFWARLVQRLLLPTITAFAAVVLGAGAIAHEREDGTILYLVATPLGRLGLVVSKVLAAWTATMLLLAPSVVVSGLVALGDRASATAILWPLAAVAVSSLCYCALIAWVAMMSRRPMILGVFYILLWEGTIATFAASADRFSIAAYGRAIAVEGVVDVNAPDASAVTAFVVLVAAAAIATRATARRLTRTELP